MKEEGKQSLNTQDVFVTDEKYIWNGGLKHVYKGPSSLSFSHSKTCIVLNLKDKKSLTDIVKALENDLKNNSEGQSTLYKIQTHPNKQRIR